jgi:hypothetical protein
MKLLLIRVRHLLLNADGRQVLCGKNAIDVQDHDELRVAIPGGWGVGGVTTLMTGFPLEFTTAQNLTNSFGGGSRPDSVQGCDTTDRFAAGRGARSDAAAAIR